MVHSAGGSTINSNMHCHKSILALISPEMLQEHNTPTTNQPFITTCHYYIRGGGDDYRAAVIAEQSSFMCVLQLLLSQHICCIQRARWVEGGPERGSVYTDCAANCHNADDLHRLTTDLHTLVTDPHTRAIDLHQSTRSTQVN